MRELALAVLITATSTAAASPLVVVNKKAEDAKDHRGSVTFIDPGTHETLGTLETGLWPRWAAFGPERRYVYVLNSGKGGFSTPSEQGTEGTLTVIDSETRAVAASVPLDPFPAKALFSSDGRTLLVICGGNKTKRPSVTAIDLVTHEPAGKVVLGERMKMFALAEDTKILGLGKLAKALRGEPYLSAVTTHGLLFVLRHPWSETHAPSELVVVDTTKMTVVATHSPLAPRGSWLSVSTNGEHVYALCRGHPKLKRAVRADALGKLYVLSARTGEIKSRRDAGFSPALLGIQRREGRIFLSAGAAAESADRLIVLDDGTIRALDMPGGRPRLLAHRPDHSGILLSTSELVVEVDTESWRIARAVPLPFDVGQIRPGPDGDRLYVAAADDGRFSYLDLSTMAWGKTLKAGRKGVKFAKGLGQVASVALTAVVVVVSAFADAAGTEPGPLAPIEFWARAAEGPAVLSVYTGPPASPALDLSRDGQRLLVLNQRTNDVTVVDTREWKVLDKFETGRGSRVILSSPNGRHHYVLASERLTVVDLGEAIRVSPNRIRDPRDDDPTLYILQRQNEIWLPRKRGMDVFALDTGELKSSIDGLPRPLMVLSPEIRSASVELPQLLEPVRDDLDVAVRRVLGHHESRSIGR